MVQHIFQCIPREKITCTNTSILEKGKLMHGTESEGSCSYNALQQQQLNLKLFRTTHPVNESWPTKTNTCSLSPHLGDAGPILHFQIFHRQLMIILKERTTQNEESVGFREGTAPCFYVRHSAAPSSLAPICSIQEKERVCPQTCLIRPLKLVWNHSTPWGRTKVSLSCLVPIGGHPWRPKATLAFLEWFFKLKR